MSTTVIVTSKNGNRKVAKAYPFVNPETSDADLKTAMTAMANLSNNTLVGIERVEKKSLLDDSAAGKKSPNLTWTPNAYTVEERGTFDKEVAALSYSGDGTITVTNKDHDGDDIWTTYENKKLTLHGYKFQTTGNGSFDVVANIAETDEYESDTATITFSWTWDNPEPEVVG